MLVTVIIKYCVLSITVYAVLLYNWQCSRVIYTSITTNTGEMHCTTMLWWLRVPRQWEFFRSVTCVPSLTQPSLCNAWLYSCITPKWNLREASCSTIPKHFKKFSAFLAQATEEQSSTKIFVANGKNNKIEWKIIENWSQVRCALQTSPEKPYHTLYYCGLGVHFGTFEIFIFPITGIVPFVIIVYVLLFLKLIVKQWMRKSRVKVQCSGRKDL